MPLLGDVMQEGTLVEWLQVDGEQVEAGQPLFSVETDKAVVEVQAPASGRLRQQVQPGDSVPVGASVGQILEAIDETEPVAAAVDAPASVAKEGGAPAATPSAEPVVSSALAPPIDAAMSRPTAVPVTTSANGEVRASPLARRIAGQHGVDLRRLQGTGPNGRIVEVDVRAYLAQRQAAAAPAAPAPAVVERPPATPSGTGVVPLRGRRRTIAERMYTSLQTMAQLTIGREVDVTRLVDVRAQLVALWEPRESVRVTITDLVVRAAALALREHPDLNAQVVGAEIHRLPDVNVAIAVDAAEGLTVPVVRQADRLPLLALARETKRLADAARSGRLVQADLSGGSFTVSAMGSFGVDWFTPIINPPQVAILGVGRIRPQPALEAGRLVERQVVSLCLTFDHRAVDGVPAARFLERIANLLTTPVALLETARAGPEP